MANTPNYNLYKPSRSDSNVEVDTSLTNNFTIIDTELKTNKDGLDTHKNDANAHTSDKITHADGSVKTMLDNHEAQLSDLQTETATLDGRVTDIETLGLEVLAPNLEGRIQTIESDVEGFLAPATFDSMDQQGYTFDEYRLGYVENRVGPLETQLADIATDAKNLGIVCDGITDDTVALQAVLDQYDKVLIPDNIKISTIHIKRNNQQVEFKGKVYVTDKGIILGDASNGVNVKGVNLKVTEVIGTDSTVVGGALVPLPTVKSGIVMEAVYFSRVTFDRIQGFEKGIYYPDGGNGTENKLLGGSIGECIKAIYFENTTPIAHEGNYILTSIFTSNTGIEISANCKYQSVQGVVDCAAITGGVDIHDKAGGNLFNLYFVRGQAEYLKLEKHSIVNIINGEESALLSIGSDSKRVIFSGNGVDIYSPSMENASVQKFYFPSESGGVGWYPRKTESNVNALSLISFNGKAGLDIRTDNGHIAFPSRLEGNLGGNFANLNMSLEVPTPTVGETVYVVDTVTNSARQYVFIGGRWRYIALT